MANHQIVLAKETRWLQLNHGQNHLKGTREANLEVDPGHALGEDNHVQGRDKDHQFSADNINLNDTKR